MTTLKVLRKARALVKKGWCQGSCAMDADGHGVWWDNPNARRWCARGAVWAAAAKLKAKSGPADSALWLLVPAGSLPAWNDHPRRTKAQVLRLFDRAIAKERKRRAKR